MTFNAKSVAEEIERLYGHGPLSNKRESLEEIINEAHAAGVAEGLEEAAKIAEKGPRPGGVVLCDGDVRDPGVVVTGFQKWIAMEIRQRMEKRG